MNIRCEKGNNKQKKVGELKWKKILKTKELHS